MKNSLKEYFFAGLVITLFGGLISSYLVENYRYKEVSNSQGTKSTCQVIKYRFWYEIKNCENPSMNQTSVGLREIENYKIN